MSRSPYDVTAFGASNGDGRDTEAIQAALDECATTGGTVRIPPGEYTTGPLVVGDDTTLHVESGAVLQFARDFAAFPAVQSRWEGRERTGFHPCLWIADASGVTVTGGGAIDGAGDYWWPMVDDPDARPSELAARLEEMRAGYERDDVSAFTLRPPLLQVSRAEGITIEGVTLRNSPFWHAHVVYSEDVTLHDLRVECPPDAPNGDGIDVDSSRFVRISDTHLDVGDDAICLKSGKDAEGRAVGRPTECVTISNCTVEHGHGGVVVGSETAGDVRDVVVSNCTFTDTDRGIRIKTTRGRGGVVDNLRFGTLAMRRVGCPLVVNAHYQTDLDRDPATVDEGTPTVRDVHVHDVTAREVETAGFLAGLPERPLEGISLSNVVLEATRSLDSTEHSPAMAGGYEQRHGLYCTDVRDLSLSDVTVETPDVPAVAVERSERVELDGLRVRDEQPRSVVLTADVDGVRVRGCESDGEPFVVADGDEPVS